jgi:hypothetical protein
MDTTSNRTPELTFNPYCNFAIIGLSDMNAKSFLLIVKGRGTMRPMKTTISKTRRTKTWQMKMYQMRLSEGRTFLYW